MWAGSAAEDAASGKGREISSARWGVHSTRTIFRSFCELRDEAVVGDSCSRLLAELLREKALRLSAKCTSERTSDR